MEVAAKHRGARLSAQKARLVADQIRGKGVEEALEVLTFSTKKAATLIKKVLESAIANAEHNDGLDVDDLRVSTVFVDTRQWEDCSRLVSYSQHDDVPVTSKCRRCQLCPHFAVHRNP